MLRIIADENIPNVAQQFAALGTVNCQPGHTITRADCLQADVLLVRSVTNINQQLLHNTPIQVVASATAGIDHLDIGYLKSQNINYYYSAGCNANAVSEYIVFCIAALRERGLLRKKNIHAGVIGLGQVGQRVKQKLNTIGYNVISNDPPRAKEEQSFLSTPLQDFQSLDLICLHTPLTQQGQYPTYHSIDQNFLQQLAPDCIIINAGRGAVIDETALRQATHLHACLDVWENEPQINPQLLEQVLLATPHIAGYSLDAKHRATTMIYEQVCQHFNITPQAPATTQPDLFTIDPHNTMTWETLLLKLYDPMAHTQSMREHCLRQPEQIAEAFIELRHRYRLRHEFKHYTLTNENLDAHSIKILKGLGFQIKG